MAGALVRAAGVVVLLRCSVAGPDTPPTPARAWKEARFTAASYWVPWRARAAAQKQMRRGSSTIAAAAVLPPPVVGSSSRHQQHSSTPAAGG